MRILGLCSYPTTSAATRYRLIQYVEPLSRQGIQLDVSPFFDEAQFSAHYGRNPIGKKLFEMAKSLFRRIGEIGSIKKYDAIIVQREAMFFGPAIFEQLFRNLGNIPLILDLDDATYVSYVSPTYGKIGSFFKFFGKTDKLISQADVVICGNRFIAEYVEKSGTRTVVIPTIVDTDQFCPIVKKNPVPIIGWIGTHSTFPLLQSIFPVLQKLAEKHKFVLRIVGAGQKEIELEGVEIENLDWNLARETHDFQSLDIGLYPITTSDSASNEWLMGKSGFKAIQYLAVGVPYVVTPLGVCREIGQANVTHFEASSDEQWYDKLDKLISSEDLRTTMGKMGRQYSLDHYALGKQTEILTKTLRNLTNYN